MAVYTAYYKTGLTGGGEDSLDEVDGGSLIDKDIAIVFASNIKYFYILDADSAAAESPPDVIAPNTNAGDKRWILQNVRDDAITYAKIQNISATDKLLGRSTAGAGNAEEIACTAFARTLLDDATATAGRTTLEAMKDIVEDTTPELGGELDAGAHSIGFTQQSATGDGTTTINWTLGNKFKFTFGAQNDTFTFIVPGNPCNVLIVMVQDATGSRTATWPASVKWPGGVAAILSTAANAIDIITFYYDGTYFYGHASYTFS